MTVAFWSVKYTKLLSHCPPKYKDKCSVIKPCDTENPQADREWWSGSWWAEDGKKQGGRGIRGSVSVHWPHCRRIITVDGGQVESPGILLRCTHVFSFSFPSPHTPISPLCPLPVSLLSFMFAPSFIRGGPICSLQGIVRVEVGDDGGKMEPAIATSPDGL